MQSKEYCIEVLQKYLSDSLTIYVIDAIKKVLSKYKAYQNNTEDQIAYIKLKKAIFDLSIELKSELITGEISKEKGEEIKAVSWELIA